MDLSESKVLVKPFSQLIRENGYTDPESWRHCVVGRAYYGLTGRDLATSASLRTGAVSNHDIRVYAAKELGIPFMVLFRAERLAAERRPVEEIASAIEALGY